MTASQTPAPAKTVDPFAAAAHHRAMREFLEARCMLLQDTVVRQEQQIAMLEETIAHRDAEIARFDEGRDVGVDDDAPGEI